MRLTSNDLMLNGLCSNILGYEDRNIKFSNNLCRYNLELDHVKDQPELYLNVLIYKVMEEYLKDLGTDLKSLEVLYNGYTSGLVGDVIPVPLLSSGWMRLVEVYNSLFEIFKEYDFAHTNIEFNKATRLRKSFNFKIDALLMKKSSSEVTLLTIVPKTHPHMTSHCSDNTDTLFALDYLYEADLNIKRVIEVSYAKDFSDKNIQVRNMYPQGYVRDAVNVALYNADHSRVNTYYCNMCPYNKKCTLRDRVKGK